MHSIISNKEDSTDHSIKILWINTYANFVGGVESYIHQTAYALGQKYHVKQYLFYSTQSRVDTTFVSPFSFSTVITSLIEQIEHLQPDLIYVHLVDNDSLLSLLSGIDIPLVAFIHDHKYFCLREYKYTTLSHQTCRRTIGLHCYSCLGFLYKKPSFPYLGVRRLSTLQKVQDSYKAFTHIVVGSEYMREHLIAHHFSPSHITKIALFSSLPQPVTPIKSPTTHQKRFLFVGQLLRGKGIDTLIDAFAMLNDSEVYLDICGEGKQRYELEDQVKRLGVQNRILFHGKIPQEQLSLYYTKAYAVVIPSRTAETFNLVGVEAMKYKKAVIASEVGGIREWLKEGITGVTFPSNNSFALKQQLEYLIKHENKTKQMGESGFEHYHQRFQTKHHVERLYSLFETLVRKESHAF